MERIHKDLLRQGKLSMTELFKPYTNKSTLVGLFLATLELVRHHGVQLEQNELFDEIWILPGETTKESIDFAAVVNVPEGEAAGGTEEATTSGGGQETVPPQPTSGDGRETAPQPAKPARGRRKTGK